MLKEFREFAVKGSVVDLAVGLIIGAAFGKVVTSVVNDLLMPPLGLLIGRVDFSNLFVPLNGVHYASLADARAAGAPTLNYGLFVNTVLEFVIIAFAVFLVVKQMNRLRREPAAVAPATKTCGHCQMTIPVAATRCPHCTSTLA